MKKLLAAPALLLGVACTSSIPPTPAEAQCTGVFSPFYVCGNPTASPAPPGPNPSVTFSSAILVPSTTTSGDIVTWGGTAGGRLSDPTSISTAQNINITGTTSLIGATTLGGTTNHTGTFQVNGNTVTFPAVAGTIGFLGTNNAWTGVNSFTTFRTPVTTGYFVNDVPPANISRVQDPMFWGDAAVNYPGTIGCPTGDWFTNFMNGTSNGACSYIGSFQNIIETKINNGNVSGGLMVAGQSSTMSSATNGAFGIAAFGMENKTGAGSRNGGGTWALYGECDKTVNNGGNCYGLEADVMTEVNVAGQPDPFTQGPIVGLQDACGSGITSPTIFNCSAGLQFAANPQPFNAAINITNGSIVSVATAIGTFPIAMALPPQAAFVWYSSAGHPVGGFDMTSTASLSIVASSTVMNGVLAVTCTAGTINPSTMAVLNGIVTHC